MNRRPAPGNDERRREEERRLNHEGRMKPAEILGGIAAAVQAHREEDDRRGQRQIEILDALLRRARERVRPTTRRRRSRPSGAPT